MIQLLAVIQKLERLIRQLERLIRLLERLIRKLNGLIQKPAVIQKLERLIRQLERLIRKLNGLIRKLHLGSETRTADSEGRSRYLWSVRQSLGTRDQSLHVNGSRPLSVGQGCSLPKSP